ncbi:DUF4136 domain-containing protein [Flavobacteriaceae bacterium MJ-SS4]|uniref:DUF4136 domain-containing protein n=1 Tax=Gilvirhabdus luticola TaxID=3079858 RepID=UPI0032DC1F35
MKKLQIIILVMTISSCSSTKVNYDFEKTTDFTVYKTYNYYIDMQTGLNELDSKRLLKAIDNQLTIKGIVLSDNPDFLINIKSSEYQEPQNSSVGVGVGGGGGNVGGGVSIGIPIGQSNINRQIIIDFVDENKNGLFWQAISESSFNPNSSPEIKEEKLNEIVTKVFSEYPPTKN